MKTFTYTIKDSVGIHARPAGLLANTAKRFDSEITLTKDDRTVNAAKLIMLMSLGVKCGETVTVTVNGSDEDEAVQAMKKAFSDNL